MYKLTLRHFLESFHFILISVKAKMAGKKPCGECDRRLPIASRLCACGFKFPSGKSSKQCAECGKRSHNARKQCSCGFIFRANGLGVIKDTELTPDRLRPRRIRMKCQVYDETDFIYNMSMLPSSQDDRFVNHRSDGKDFYRESYESDLFNRQHTDLLDRDLQSLGSKSKENVDVNLKQEVSLKFERHERDYISAGDKPESQEKRMECDVAGVEQSLLNKTIASSEHLNDTTKKTKLSAPPNTNSTPLSSLIRGEVTKSLQTKLNESPDVRENVEPTSDSDSRSFKTESQSEESEEDNMLLSELLRLRKRHIDSSMDDSTGTEDAGDSVAVGVPLIAGRPGSAQIETICLNGVRTESTVVKRGRGRPRKHRKEKATAAAAITKVKKMQIRPQGTNPLGDHDAKLETCIKLSTTRRRPISPSNISTNSISDPPTTIQTLTPSKRGRPKGCKDSKKRKPRHDYLNRLTERNENIEDILKTGDTGSTRLSHSPITLTRPRGRPSLMASDKSKHEKDSHGGGEGGCRMGSMNADEIEQIEKRLNKTDPWIIPDHKKELFSLILSEINLRIYSQSFQSTI